MRKVLTPLALALALGCVPTTVGDVVVDGPPPAPNILPPPPPPPPPDEPPPDPEVCFSSLTERDLATDALLRQENSTFNAFGDELLTSRDRDGDGVTDEEIVREFDSEGRLIRVDTDTDADGAVDEIERFDYEQGRLVQRSFDADADGAFEELDLWAYSEDGQLTMHTQDLDGDFNVDYAERRRYDDAGRLIERTIDNDGDDIVDDRTTRTWDDFGVLTTVFDYGDDGVPEYQFARLRSPPERLEVERYDDDGDGEIERRVEARYDPEDRRRVVQTETTGEPLEHQFLDYDGGRLIRIDTARGDTEGSWTWSYDELGRITGELRDEGLDGVYEYEYTSTYEDDVLYAFSRVQRGPSGILERTTLATSPIRGSTRVTVLDLDGDGVADTRSLFELDLRASEPRLELHDDDADGQFDRRIVRTYDCLWD